MITKDLKPVVKEKKIGKIIDTEVICDYRTPTQLAWGTDGPFHKNWLRIKKNEPEELRKIHAEMIAVQYARDMGES